METFVPVLLKPLGILVTTARVLLKRSEPGVGTPSMCLSVWEDVVITQQAVQELLMLIFEFVLTQIRIYGSAIKTTEIQAVPVSLVFVVLIVA